MAVRTNLKCPCCEKMRRRQNYIFCLDCWRTSPLRERRACQRIVRLDESERKTALQMVEAIRALVQATRSVQYGMAQDASTNDVLGAYSE